MITENIAQGSIEWLKARAGIPTSSNFDKIITTAGKPSKQREKYLFTLVAEKITGVKEETYQNSIMRRGVELEDEARNMYSLITGNEVEQVGICYSDEKKLWASSPDGLIGEDGLVEIKVPLAYTHIGYLFANELPSDYVQQLQGQLLVTGRKWVDFFSYYPGLKPLIIRVKPDEKFLKALRIELEVFVKELDEVTKKIRR